MNPTNTNTDESFWSRVQKDAPGGCWLWTGTDSGKGYGVLRWQGRQQRAHRVAYELLRGPILDETLDHLCRTKKCVNPDHLEPVPNRTNVLRGNGHTAQNARKTHCKRGHEFTPENTRVRPERNERGCLVCMHMRWRQPRKANR